MKSSIVASVVVDQSTYSFDKPYSYAIPTSLESSCIPGCRVVVPFGRSNSKRQGIVLSVSSCSDTTKLKCVSSVIDTEPVLSDEMLLMTEWLKEHTFCTYFDAVHAVLPTGLNTRLVSLYSAVNNSSLPEDDECRRIVEYIKKQKSGVSSEKIEIAFGLTGASKLLDKLVNDGFLLKKDNPLRRVGDATVRMVRLCDDNAEQPPVKLTPKQLSVFKLLRDAGTLSIKEITYFTDVGTAVINNLEKYGIVEVFEQEYYRAPSTEAVKTDTADIRLTDEQSKAYDTVNKCIDGKKSETVLLHGVTGSGKTQVFLKLVDKVEASGKGVIVMVPEIALTPQMLKIFKSRYGNKVALFHSAMSLGQRLDEWKRIKDGVATIALGTRSAVFAPFKEIGLIVMDEEQERSYKSEQSPRFDARDLARFRSAYHKCVCLFSSATPSIETYSAAVSGKYRLCTIQNRFGNAVLPQVIPIDMREETLSGNNGNISVQLADEIGKTLDGGKQAILLLNRRGHNTFVSCPSCGYVATCKNCSISMTYHSANGRLMCHYCGYSEPYSNTCPQCGGNHLRFSGAGTQRIEDELSALFPKARTLRLDADTTMARGAFQKKLSAFSKGEYDILLGTQMVAKGLDFPNVTLVGVLCADQSMYSDDYRCFERTFSLLTQVVGRSGRGDTAGKAFIQTLNPESSVIKLAARQDYEEFFEQEIATRKLMIYPPYCDIVTAVTTSTLQQRASDAAQYFTESIKQLVDAEFSDVKLIILRPTPTAVPRVNNKYRYRIIIKCKNNKRFRAMFCEALDEFYKNNSNKNTGIYVDVNPDGNI